MVFPLQIKKKSYTHTQIVYFISSFPGDFFCHLMAICIQYTCICICIFIFLYTNTHIYICLYIYIWCPTPISKDFLRLFPKNSSWMADWSDKRSCHLRWWKESMSFLVRRRETWRCHRCVWVLKNAVALFCPLGVSSSCVLYVFFYRMMNVNLLSLCIINIYLYIYIYVYMYIYVHISWGCVYISSILCTIISICRCFRNTCWWPFCECCNVGTNQ